MKYRKKLLEIEAIQYTGDNVGEILRFTEGEGRARTNTCSSHLTIPSREGNHKAMVNDFVIKAEKGEFHPCKSDIFNDIYELVE